MGYNDLSECTLTRALDRVMGDFDFEKAANALRGCGWKYKGASASPSVNELKTIAKEITMRVMQYGSRSSVSQGPLTAEARHYDTPAVVSVSLTLTPVNSTAVYIILELYGKPIVFAIADSEQVVPKLEAKSE